MADVSQLYKEVWKGNANPQEAALQASEIYTQAAQEAGEAACFRGAIKYGADGVATSANFRRFRACGKSFGAHVAKSSKVGSRTYAV